MTAAELIAFLQTVPPDTLVVADDRDIPCDIEPAMGAVIPVKGRPKGTWWTVDLRHSGATPAVVL